MSDANDTKINIEEVFENFKKDATLNSNLDIEGMLENVKDDNGDLENKTLNDIMDTNMEILKTIGLDDDVFKKYCEKLVDYRYVDDLYQLKPGRFIRWVNKKNQLTNGAIVADIVFRELGTNIMCKNTNQRCLQLKFDDNIIFQKLTQDEQLVLMAYEYIEKNVD